MGKQAEVKKAIKTCIAIETSCGEFDGNRLTKNILRVESELGVVIKVDRELPENRWLSGYYVSYGHYEPTHDAIEEYKEDMLKAGYVATESLVEE